MTQEFTPLPPERPSLRPRAALAFLLAPIIAGTLLVGATVGWFFVVRGTDGEARGDWARITITAPCDISAAVSTRLDDLGLEHRFEDGAWVVHLPGMDDDLTHIPQVLIRPGVLTLTADGAPAENVVVDVGVQLAFSGTPITLVSLEAPMPEKGLIQAQIDDEKVEIELATGAELQIAARAGDSVTALRTATERAIALRHPMPCAAESSPATPLP